MKSYSQHGQDVFLYESYFKEIPNGYFIDIGAHDGVSLSNSYFYEIIGWSGICVEPNSEVFKKCESCRKCLCVNACLLDVTRTVDFLQIHGYSEMLSGIIDFHDKKHSNRINKEIEKYGGSKKVIKINGYSFEDFASIYSIPVKINYMSVDVEGGELYVLKNIDFARYSFDIISCENNNGTQEVSDLLFKHGYQKVKQIGADEIFKKNNN